MGQSPVPMKPRPKSEDVSRFNGPNDSGPQTPQHPGIDQGGFVGTPGQKPLHMQHGARSSPALAGMMSQMWKFNVYFKQFENCL